MKRNAVRSHPADNVATLLCDVAAGASVSWDGEASITTRESVPEGHKVALDGIPPGEAVRKYGHPIGTADREIAAGEHVHTHNLARAED
jgi:altronate hydrolase